MRKTYQQPEIWVEELKMENQVLAGSVKDIQTNLGESTLKYGGGGDGPARAGENNLWDDEEDDSGWDNL